MFTFTGFHNVIVGICFFKLVTGQNVSFQSVELRDECTTALIAVEVVFTGPFQLEWYAVRGHVKAQIVLISFTETGKIYFNQVENKLFSLNDFDFSFFPKFFSPSTSEKRNTITLSITNWDVNENIEFRVENKTTESDGLSSNLVSKNVSAPLCNVEDEYCQNTPVESKIVCGSVFVKQPNNTDQDPIPVKCLENGSLNTTTKCLSIFNKSKSIRAPIAVVILCGDIVVILVSVALLFRMHRERKLTTNISELEQLTANLEVEK